MGWVGRISSDAQGGGWPPLVVVAVQAGWRDGRRDGGTHRGSEGQETRQPLFPKRGGRRSRAMRRQRAVAGQGVIMGGARNAQALARWAAGHP